jgi:flagellar capping protein FliD
MTLVLGFLKSFWKEIFVVLLVSGILYTGYYKVKHIGYKEAAEECAQKSKEYNDKLDKLIDKISENSELLIASSEASSASLKKDFGTILTTIRNKPLYVIEQGKCTPSKDFVDAYNEAVDRVNQ